MAKGRKAQAKATAATKLAAELLNRPARQIFPTIGLNSINGANAHNLALHRLRQRPLTAAELAEWSKVASALGLPRPEQTADEVLLHFVKDLPASVTLLPADPEEDWATAGEWLATTGAPNYTPAPGRHVREIDPEKTAQGSSPLLAVLALVEKNIARKSWAFAGRAHIQGDPRIQLYPVVAEFYRRSNLPFS